MSRPGLLPIFGALLLISLSPVRAAACWDGFTAREGHVLVMGSDPEWTLDRARHLAQWLPRIEALLTYANADIEASYGLVSGSTSDGRGFEAQYPDGKMDRLFGVLARALQVPPAVRRAALSAPRRGWTVQLAASRDRRAAERLVGQATQFDDLGAHGFYEAGGFPADNPFVHLVDARDAQGRTVTRVLMGAFLDRAEATQLAAELRAHTPFEAFVRPL